MKRAQQIFLIAAILEWIFIGGICSENITITGKVTSQGKGVSNVMITDGENCVRTDNEGNYKIGTSSDNQFIYYTLPKGYNSPLVQGVPVFYSKIDKYGKQQKVNFEIIKSTVSQQKHAFILWADPQVAEKKEFELLDKVRADAQSTISELRSKMPVHGICVGDLVFDQQNLFPDYKNVIGRLNIPFYQVIGNHDMDYNERSNEQSDKSYSSFFGPSHYSFNVGNIHYVVMNDVFYYGFSYRYIGYIEEKQLSWLEKDLQAVKPGSTVVISFHIPTTYGESEKAPSYDYLMSNEVMNKKALFSILKPFNTHILAGHSHIQWNTQFSPNLLEHVHAAACGAWWQGEISTDGSPKGYTVYIADNDSLSWYFKGVGKDKTEQFKVYEPGMDQEISDCFIANVYNYDPKWKIMWYEDGVYKGEMQQYWGKDPLAAQMYKPGENKKYSWLSISETNHLFKAKPEKAESEILIEVRDRFGNIYRKEFRNKAIQASM